MIGNIENLKLSSAYEGVSKDITTVKEKKAHSILFRTKGERIFEFDDGNVMTMKTGDVVFLPKGSSYTSKKISQEATEYVSITFEADLTDSEPSLYSADDFLEKEYMINHFVHLWRFGNRSEKLKCYSLFYSLISYLSNIDNQKYAEKKKFKVIECGVEYLQKHIFDVDFKTSVLAEVSGISDTYFRKIFISRFGTTPQNYVTSKRLSHAKAILDNGGKQKISELALSVGFSDPLYFSKSFKNKYGYSPSKG